MDEYEVHSGTAVHFASHHIEMGCKERFLTDMFELGHFVSVIMLFIVSKCTNNKRQ